MKITSEEFQLALEKVTTNELQIILENIKFKRVLELASVIQDFIEDSIIYKPDWG